MVGDDQTRWTDRGRGRGRALPGCGALSCYRELEGTVKHNWVGCRFEKADVGSQKQFASIVLDLNLVDLVAPLSRILLAPTCESVPPQPGTTNRLLPVDGSGKFPELNCVQRSENKAEYIRNEGKEDGRPD